MNSKLFQTYFIKGGTTNPRRLVALMTEFVILTPVICM